MFDIILTILVLIAIAFGHIPKFRMNRTTIAFVGASCFIISGVIDYEEAIKAIDMNTIVLLFSMMVINANFSVSGFFGLVSAKILKFADTPKKLLLLIIFLSGYMSAVLLNDTVVIMFTPIVLYIVLSVNRNPIPYLIGLGLSANIGSAMTPIGNPQNILIAGYSGLKFLGFLKPLFFVSTISMFFIYIVLSILYKREITSVKFVLERDIEYRIYKPLLIKSLVSVVIMIFLFLMEVDLSFAALIGASILLVTRRIKPERVFREVDWSLLVFFASLFIITGSVVVSGIDKKLFLIFENTIFQNFYYFSFFVAVFSNLVSNVPAVMIMSPIIKMAENSQIYWIVTAMSSTFAGNLTVIGSVANIIVVEIAKRKGVNISFFEFFKSGFIVTVITILFGSVWLSWLF
ncbi:MAG: anion transporter [Calditerrivibrio sp.]|nr:anion transporter [Calditerrivibrio sp.]MCA1932180.1 anion transporter [Calditerrivibrio sp.]MCA1980388.1 anion transporter [Calditerrivibrio sp.]